MDGDTKMPLYASRLKEIWNRDGSETFKLPTITYDIILSNSLKEAIEAHREDLRATLDKHKIQIDESKLMFKINYTRIKNNKITWIMINSQIVKFNNVYRRPIEDMREYEIGIEDRSGDE